MSETLKILTIKKTSRGATTFKARTGGGDVTIYRLKDNDGAKRGMKMRRGRTTAQAFLARETVVAIEHHPEKDAPQSASPAIDRTSANPDLNKFKAAFGTLKGLKVFGDDAVQFQREMRDEWR